MSAEVYSALVEAIYDAEKQGQEPKRIEISRKFKNKLVDEVVPREGSKTFEPYLEGIFEADVEVREDVERFKLITEVPGKTVVRTVHGCEYL